MARGIRRARAAAEDLSRYQTDPVAYFREVLHVEPWAGCNGKKGQLELLQDIGASIAAQLAGDDNATRWFKVDAGHGVGKTYCGAGIVNWYFDCFPPSITMTTAPSAPQVEKLLWKDIKKLRPKELPGEVLQLELRKGPDHFALGRTTNDSGGKGTERFQGQHGPFLLFILDEAEGLPPFVFGAVDAMMTGGIVLCIMFANPKTRTSDYHKKGSHKGVAKYRLSVLDHPNVVQGRDVVPGASTRRWVCEKIANLCEPVDEHSDDDFTFTVPYAVAFKEGEGAWPPGTIFKPSSEFLFRVMGIAPKNLSTNAIITPGRYEAACNRERVGQHPQRATFGVDCARGGADFGTLFVRHDGALWRAAQLFHADTGTYLEAIKKEARKLHSQGVTHLHIRVDGSGGYGAGVVDGCRADLELDRLFNTYDDEGNPIGELKVLEVQFGAGACDETAYADQVTEMYAEAAETLRAVTLINPPAELEDDLTARRYGWKNRSGETVKKLEDKEAFRKRVERSPDDGDGAVLALAPDHIFPEGVWLLIT